MNTTENNALIYCTVLKNKSIHTPIFKKAFKMAEEFEKNIKYQGSNTNEFWQAQANRDFINLLEAEIKKMKDMQNDALNQIVFLIK